MIKRFFVSAILVMPLLLLGFQETPAKFFPKDGEVEGWIKHRSLRHYRGENLYEYINGGAEIYHEYGFVQVVTQDYANDSGKSISVEIYQMVSPTSAYGMYTFKTDSKGKKILVGSDAQLADYYMNFWQGSFLITLTGFDETEETQKGLLDIAKRVVSRLPAGGEKPRIVSCLPEEDLVNESYKYFVGFLGLRNSHPFFSLNIMGYEEGVKGDYAGGFSLFLFRFEGEKESQKAYLAVKGQKDSRGRGMFATTHREYLMLVLGDADSVRSKQAFERAAQKIHELE
jgi:hypothetical protein